MFRSVIFIKQRTVDGVKMTSMHAMAILMDTTYDTLKDAFIGKFEDIEKKSESTKSVDIPWDNTTLI